jgi:hypothetical protein
VLGDESRSPRCVRAHGQCIRAMRGVLWGKVRTRPRRPETARGHEAGRVPESGTGTGALRYGGGWARRPRRGATADLHHGRYAFAAAYLGLHRRHTVVPKQGRGGIPRVKPQVSPGIEVVVDTTDGRVVTVWRRGRKP